MDIMETLNDLLSCSGRDDGLAGQVYAGVDRSRIMLHCYATLANAAVSVHCSTPSEVRLSGSGMRFFCLREAEPASIRYADCWRATDS